MFPIQQWLLFHPGRTFVRVRLARPTRPQSYQPKIEDLENRLVPDATVPGVYIAVPSHAYATWPVPVGVTVSADSGTPTGSVDLWDGLKNYGNSLLDYAGTANFTVYFDKERHCDGLEPAILTSHYSSDDWTKFLDSDGVSSCIEVDPAPTDMELDSTPNPSIYGEEVTFTATVRVRPPGEGTPAGKVVFRDGQTVLARVDLDESGQASFTTADLSVGTHTITAVYKGNETYARSRANLVQTVQEHGPASRLFLTAPAAVPVNTVFGLTVSALDAFENIDPDYRGTIDFTSSDLAARLPFAYTFVAGDQGTHLFQASLGTPGKQFIWAIDLADPTIVGSAGITVSGAASPGRDHGAAPGWAVLPKVNNPPPSAVPLPAPVPVATQVHDVENNAKAAAPVVPIRQADERQVAWTGPAATTAATDFWELAATDGILWDGLMPTWPGTREEKCPQWP